MKKKILVQGPCLSQSGYGCQTRFALKALRSREDKFDIYIEPTPWGKTGWLWEDDEFRQWMDERIIKTQVLSNQKALVVDISLQITIPIEWKKKAPINIGYTAGIETNKVSPQWLPKGNDMDKILVVSNHAKTTYETTVAVAKNSQTGQELPYKLHTPIEVVHELTDRSVPEEIHTLKLEYDFNFLAVSQWGPRKNFENTIQWWVEEFIDQEVGLVIKTNILNNSTNDRNHTYERVKFLLDKYPDRKCKVYLLHGDLSNGQMTGLYQNEKIKALINIAHGEGFGLPLFEAAREGLPIITVEWSGQTDFLNHNGKNFFQTVDYDMQPIQQHAVWPGVLEGDTMWAYARQGSYKMALRKIYKKWPQAKELAEELKSLVNEKFNEETLYSRFNNAILGISNKEPTPVNGISFCIPTNGAKPEKTKLTIRSIQREMGAHPHEIILAGDIKNFENIEGVTLVDKSEEAHSGKVATLRNAAADNSKFNTIAWCDDDIIIGKDWLTTTLEYSTNYGWDVLGCKVQCPDGTRYWDRATLQPHQLVDYDHPEYAKTLYQSSAFFLTRKAVFEEVRWDDDKVVYADRQGGIPEDVQFSMDLIKAGYSISFNSTSLVWHNDDSYTEFYSGQSSLTLKKEVLTEKFDMHFFLPPEEEFEDLQESLLEAS